MHNNKRQSAEASALIHALILLTAAVIWVTFLAGRCWIAVAFLVPVVAIADRVRERGQVTGRAGGADGDAAAGAVSTGRPVTAAQRRMLLVSGCVCGLFLFAASAAQQIGIGMTTTAKAGFITALYVILVPIVSLFLGHKSSLKIWVSVALGVTGLYFLCMKGGFTGLNRGFHLVKDTTSKPTLTFAQPIQPEGWITRKGGMRPVEG